MKKKFKFDIKSKHLIIVMTIIAVSLIVLSLTARGVASPVRNVAGYVVTPFQNGINTVGEWLTDQAGAFKNVKKLSSENEELQAQVNELTTQNQELLQNQSELERLQKLYAIDEQYSEYEKTGATIISKDPGNWYSTFVISKGTADGLAVDMNVIADGGLVGIITETGTNWSTVRSIIDDASNVSGMIASTSDNCVVTGNLLSMNEDKIDFSQLTAEKDTVHEGDAVVTSDVSDKYLTGIMIGYISETKLDSNNLTSSGTIIPSVDFKHLREVLVIKDLKQQKEEAK